MDVFQALILGFVQGITEWLPISSSGHLVLAEKILGIHQPIFFAVMLHLGSLFVVLFVFREEIKRLISGILRGEKRSVQTVLKLVVASIPIALVGFFLKDFIESAFSSLLVVGAGLILTSVLLFMTRKLPIKRVSIGYKEAGIIGVAQAFAILPGVSRSGSTVSAGLLQGVEREEAASFAFLMFIPAIIGAAIVELPSAVVTDITPVVAGTVAATLVGYLSLSALLKIIRGGKLYWFSIYCAILGIVVLLIHFL